MTAVATVQKGFTPFMKSVSSILRPWKDTEERFCFKVGCDVSTLGFQKDRSDYRVESGLEGAALEPKLLWQDFNVGPLWHHVDAHLEFMT